MAGHVSNSHLAKLSFTVSRPRIPFGWRYMGQDVIIWSAVCSSAPHSQDAVEDMPHLCIDNRKRPTPVRRRFIRTQTSLRSPIPYERASTSSKSECRREVPPATQCSTAATHSGSFIHIEQFHVVKPLINLAVLKQFREKMRKRPQRWRSGGFTKTMPHAT